MKESISRDILWKGIIEDLFEDFLIYFYPNDFQLFDFSRGFIFLDKELEQISIPSPSKNRIADKLVKVFTKEGKEKWILIHIEVQGYEDKYFSERMFTYYYRIFDKYKQRIGALALFTDDIPNFRPNNFESLFLETNISFSYKTFKLSDYQPTDFQKSENPFAIVMETAWYGLKKNKLADENLFALKLDLARRLNKKGFHKDTFGKLCSFIKTYVTFENSELLPKLDTEIDSINQTTRPMGIIEAIQEERIRQATEKVTKEVTQKVMNEFIQESCQKLFNKGFSAESIAEMLDYPIDTVKKFIS